MGLGICYMNLRYVVVPEAFYLGEILMQVAPESTFPQIEKNLLEVATLDGVLETKDEHFWSIDEHEVVGSMVVRIRGDADERKLEPSPLFLFS